MSQSKPYLLKLRRWHQWLGLGLAAPLLLIIVTGTLLVYKEALITLAITDQPPPPHRFQSLNEELSALEQQLSHQQLSYIKAPSAGRDYWTVVESSGRSTLFARHSFTELQLPAGVLATLDIIRELHTDLMLHTPGEIAALCLGLVLSFFALSGIILWWPAWRRYRFSKLLPKKFSPQQLLISHRHQGLLLSLFILVIAVSGVVMLSNGFIYQLNSASSKPAPAAIKEASLVNQTGQSHQLAAGQLLQAAQILLPDAQLTLARLPSKDRPAAEFRFRLKDEWHPNGRSKVAVDGHSGQATVLSRADQASNGRKFLNVMYPLHSSYGLNRGYQLGVFIAGLVALYLTLSGSASYVLRWRKKHRPQTKIFKQ